MSTRWAGGCWLAMTILMTAPGCGGAGCDAIADAGERVACRVAKNTPLVGDPDALTESMSSIEAPTEHDLVALQLMVQHPSLLPILCPKMRTDSAADRCQRLEQRPHLSERARRPEPR